MPEIAEIRTLYSTQTCAIDGHYVMLGCYQLWAHIHSNLDICTKPSYWIKKSTRQDYFCLVQEVNESLTSNYAIAWNFKQSMERNNFSQWASQIEVFLDELTSVVLGRIKKFRGISSPPKFPVSAEKFSPISIFPWENVLKKWISVWLNKRKMLFQASRFWRTKRTSMLH